MMKKKHIIMLVIRVDEGGELAHSTEFCSSVLDHTLNLETTGGYCSVLNGKIERPHQTIAKMFNAALIDSGHAKNKWCLACEATAEVYNNCYHQATKKQPNFLWFGTRSSIHDFRLWGCEVYVQSHITTASSDRVTRGYFMGYTNSRVIIRWWDLKTNTIKHSTGVKFNE